MNATPADCVVATIPGSCETERLLVTLRTAAGQGSQLVLQQQSFADGLGWFTQSSVELEPHQMAMLRQSLGSAQQIAPARPVPPRTPEWLKVYHAESA